MIEAHSLRAGAVLYALLSSIASATAQSTSLPDSCSRDSMRALEPSASLYCMDLIPVPDLPLLSGTAKLGHARSPFGVALTSDGHHLYDITITLSGLRYLHHFSRHFHLTTMGCHDATIRSKGSAEVQR